MANLIPLKLKEHWRGIAAGVDCLQRKIPPTIWQRAVEMSQRPDGRCVRIISENSKSSVKHVTVELQGVRLEAAVKNQRNFPVAYFLMGGMSRIKSVRNFYTASVLRQGGVGCPEPLAALWKTEKGCVSRTIYISGFVKGSRNLHDFIRENLREDAGQYILRRDISFQIAEALAGMSRLGMVHRDAKASNFLIGPGENSSYRIYFADMDGLKHKQIWARSRDFRDIVKFGSTQLYNGFLHRSDFLRMYKKYIELSGRDWQATRHKFKGLSESATAMRILTAVKSAVNQK